jgi:hypothetical protein
MVAADANAKKRYEAAHALIEPPSPTPPPVPSVTRLRRTTTMRAPSSPTSTSRPPTCRTSILSSRSCWTPPPRTMLGGATTSYSLSGVTLFLSLSLRSRANGHHVCQRHSGLGPDGQRHQVMNLVHHLPRPPGHHPATRPHGSRCLAGPGQPLPRQL